MVGCGGVQLGLRSDGHSCADEMFEVGVEPLVRIELWAITGKIEDFNVGSVVGEPCLDGLAVMHAEVVEAANSCAETPPISSVAPRATRPVIIFLPTMFVNSIFACSQTP